VDEQRPVPGGEPDGDATLARLKAARRSAHPVFGDTPIQMPPPAVERVPKEKADEAAPALEPRVRQAALAAALKAGSLACCAAVFMGFILACSLGNLLPGGWSLFLGLFVIIIGAPVAVFSAVSSYRQTLETERHKVGLCPRCGYDLRGSTGVRCPECGTRIRSPGQTKAPWTQEEQDREEYQ
jgi:hypothetical protein